MNTKPSGRPSALRAWLLTTRPRTLPAAIAPVLVGSAVAAHEGGFSAWPAFWALWGAAFLQIGANLANDLFDFRKGADTGDRLGPPRATAQGWISPRAVAWGTAAAFGLAAIAGVALVSAGGWPVVAVGVASILAALAYTGGPWPLGYHGLGDVFAFLFFGPVAVCGTVYVQTGAVGGLALATSVPVGLLVAAILVVNNLRDRRTDAAAGKRTLAVRMGASGARVEFVALVATSYAIAVGLAAALADPWLALPLVSLPWAWRRARDVRDRDGRALNPVLGGTANLAALFAGLLALGLIAGGAA